MRLTLFDEKHKYTEMANSVERHKNFYGTVTELFDHWCKRQDYSPREVAYILQSVIRDIELGTILDFKFDRSKDAT